MPINYQQALQKLASIKQQHLLNYWNHLARDQKDKLLVQIEHLDPAVLQMQQQLLQPSSQTSPLSLQPFSSIASSGNLYDVQEGKKLIAQGAMGCLIVAGGQGTRLNFEGPKGMFPISPVAHKSLFQIFAEKVSAASRQAQIRLPLAIMTSPANHDETIAFFNNHANFGLEPDQIAFFPQSTLPLLNPSGNLFLEAQDTIAMGSDGNGSALRLFYQSGIWESWHQRGIRYLNFVVVDNPLADPFDAEMLGFQHRTQSEITVKCVKRRDAKEQVGVLAKQNDQTIVVEYTEMPEWVRSDVLPDGTLLFPCANISLFSFGMNFIKKLAGGLDRLPLHAAFKTAKCLAQGDASQHAEQTRAWKFEKFIFDVLPLAEKVSAVMYPREDCFAPLKNFSGENSISTVRSALQKRDQMIFSKVSGYPCCTMPFEIAQEFYYPTSGLLTKWHGKPPPHAGYIEA